MDEAELIQALVDLKLYAEATGQFFLAHLIGLAALEARQGRAAGSQTKKHDKVESGH